jgi:hypothetical protein
MSRLLLSFALLVFMVGCGEEISADPTCASELSVSGGVRPTYQFDGGPVQAISVVRKAKPDVIVWGLASPDRDGIEPGLKHGDRPPGIIETSRDEPALKQASTYLVRIERLSGEVCFYEFTP